MSNRKAQIRKIENLLEQMSAEDLINMVDIVNEQRKSKLQFKITFSNDEKAIAWFKQFCAQNKVTPERTLTRDGKPYGLYYVKEFGQTGFNPETKQYNAYFQLWIKDGHQNADTMEPHIELGSSFYDLWDTGNTMQELEAKMEHICTMRKTEVDKQ